MANAIQVQASRRQSDMVQAARDRAAQASLAATIRRNAVNPYVLARRGLRQGDCRFVDAQANLIGFASRY